MRTIKGPFKTTGCLQNITYLFFGQCQVSKKLEIQSQTQRPMFFKLEIQCQDKCIKSVKRTRTSPSKTSPKIIAINSKTHIKMKLRSEGNRRWRVKEKHKTYRSKHMAVHEWAKQFKLSKARSQSHIKSTHKQGIFKVTPY